MKTILGFLLLLAATSADSFGMMGVEDVAKILGKPDVYIFDANTESTFKEGHVPGAKFVVYRTYPESDLPKNKEATLIFYCKNRH